jgi:hypothetical protein
VRKYLKIKSISAIFIEKNKQKREKIEREIRIGSKKTVKK